MKQEAGIHQGLSQTFLVCLEVESLSIRRFLASAIVAKPINSGGRHQMGYPTAPYLENGIQRNNVTTLYVDPDLPRYGGQFAYLIPCNCGSIIRGQRWHCVIIPPFSMLIWSEGRRSFCHSATYRSRLKCFGGITVFDSNHRLILDVREVVPFGDRGYTPIKRGGVITSILNEGSSHRFSIFICAWLLPFLTYAISGIAHNRGLLSILAVHFRPSPPV